MINEYLFLQEYNKLFPLCLIIIISKWIKSFTSSSISLPEFGASFFPLLAILLGLFVIYADFIINYTS